MTLIGGVVLIVLTVSLFVYSLPRGGKTARFVGSEWEGYVVVAMVGALSIGLIMTIVGAAQL